MLQITWLGHGTFLLRLNSGAHVLIDPWIDGNPSSPAGFSLPKIDLMLITHGHFDHMADAIQIARQHGCKVVANYEICSWLASKGVQNTSGMNKGGMQDAGELKVTMTHAVHSSSIQDGDQLIYGGEPGGYILHLDGGRNVYFAGDTAVFSDMALYADLYRPELAFLPIGDFFTMGPEQATLAARLLNVRTVIPMHYATFPLLTGTPGAVQSLLDGTDIEVIALQPGHPVSWGA